MSECSDTKETGVRSQETGGSRRASPVPPQAAGFGLQVAGARARRLGRLGRLAIGVLAIAALGFAVSQAGRLPGSAGELLRANIETDRDTTGLFYTEVDGWHEWLVR